MFTITSALVAILMMATLIQFLTDISKNLLPAMAVKFFNPPLIAAMYGIILAVIFKLDLFLILGFETPYAMASWVLTGLILSSGSSAVHELIAKLRDSRQADIDDVDTGG